MNRRYRVKVKATFPDGGWDSETITVLARTADAARMKAIDRFLQYAPHEEYKHATIEARSRYAPLRG